MSAADACERARAVRERARNVLVDASAGTGKTRLVVERFVELLCPRDEHPAIPIERLAAITFTRKAAGELRVRVRQHVLEKLAVLPPRDARVPPLQRALAGLDTAHLGTIHGFADRLLRKWPAEARLDPRYQLADDSRALADECFQLLVHASEAQTLGDVLGGTPLAPRADEASTTVYDLQRAGLRLRSFEGEHWTYHGLDGLIAGFVLHRDLDVDEPAPRDFDRAAFERFADEYLHWVEGLSTQTRGGRWLVETGEIVRRMRDEPDPAIVYRELVERLERGPRGRASDVPRQRFDFPDDRRAWDVWKAFDGDTRQRPVRHGALREDLLAPMRRWLATRLVRLRPVVLHLYELIKARHQVVDHVDLLLRLRDVLRDEPQVRRACQAMFDHLFIDEVQDTDPLQAEIVMFLCERGAAATSWTDVTPAPGTLTLVGDPKQSIYRFRRADIVTYQRMREIVARGPCLEVQLTSSWRSAPDLVTWINSRFAPIFGAAGDAGQVRYQPLARGRTSGQAQTVHAVSLHLSDGGDAARYRTFEADAMARYLRWLVEISGVRIHDRYTGAPRALRYGDVGVLAFTTTHLPVLFEHLDRDGVPYSARGGTLFLSDPLHRRFLLALCALADRDDGVAWASLLRPPFFALDLGDLARARSDDPSERASQARAIVTELRRRRFERSVGATARALVEETGLGATVARGPNGAQRLRGLRELCLQLEVRAAEEHLDFDAIVARVRAWVDAPIGLERPAPVTADAVRILTVHQAKGLEFPVVMLWDARAPWSERARFEPWTIEPEGRAWALRLEHLSWEEPLGANIAERERRMQEAERKRLAYVAVTRARDLLVIPRFVDAPAGRAILGSLVGGCEDDPTVLVQPVHAPSAPADWYLAAAAPSGAPVDEITGRDIELRRLWEERARHASAPVLRPVAFSDASSPRALWDKRGRFGTRFGATVHLAIAMVLEQGLSPDVAVERAAGSAGLRAHRAEAIEDVRRALSTLAQLGVGVDRRAFRLELPLAGVSERGELVAGYADLVALVDDTTVVLDFKTDTPPADDSSIPERYVDQVLGYAHVLAQGLGVERVRAGLLFTADGGVRWVSRAVQLVARARPDTPAKGAAT